MSYFPTPYFLRFEINVVLIDGGTQSTDAIRLSLLIQFRFKNTCHM